MFTPTGEFVACLCEGGAVKCASDAAVLAGGELLVLSLSHSGHRITVLTPDGRAVLRYWVGELDSDGRFLTPIAVDVGPKGLLYVLDYDKPCVQVFE